jgi:L-lactate dehydrogenase complex protein LldG
VKKGRRRGCDEGNEAAGPYALKCVHAGNCKEVCPVDIDIPQVIQEVKKRYLKIALSKPTR